MIKLIYNEILKVKISKIIFTYILMIISLILINKYSDNSLFDMSFNLIPFVGILVSLLFSGSICFEIENGSMKYYLTKPYKRYKIYISKLISIIIYIILSYFTIVICTSLLEKSINYKYMLKLFIHIVPIIFLGSYVMCLSTIFKNHVFVSCASILTLCFSLTISQIFFGIKLNIIEYTFLPYLDFSIFNDELLIKNMNRELGIHLNNNVGILIDIIYFLILCLLGIKKFNKKDIRN